MTTVEVKTSTYEFSHGFPPRGGGYWAFLIGEKQEFILGNKLYREAKKAAQAIAKERGIAVIEVLP